MRTLTWRLPGYPRFHPANLWAGLTLSVYSIFGGLPLYLAVVAQLRLDDVESASLLFGVYGTSAIFTTVVSLYYRQPVSLTTTLPPVLLLGSLAGRFTFADMVGACFVASVLIVVFGAVGIGRRVIDWVPLPIVMGMFAGSILGFVTRMVEASVADAVIAGSTIGGYLAGRVLQCTAVPPIALALVAGGVAVAATGGASGTPVDWAMPRFGFPDVSFSVAAILSITLPVLLLSMVLGNIEGFSFLRSQGYDVPINRITVLSGFHSLANAAFGAPPANVGRVAVAMIAGPDAGPRETRYWGNIVAAASWVPLVVGLGVVASLIDVLPTTFIVMMGGLAILGSLQSAFDRAFRGTLRFGALVALAVAATPIVALGLPGAFWAIPAGIVASLAGERGELVAYWRPDRSAAA